MRHHRHALHRRQPDEFDFGFDDTTDSAQDSLIPNKPQIVKRQVLTVYKTLTVTHARQTKTTSQVSTASAAAKENAESTRSSIHSTVTLTSTSVSAPTTTITGESLLSTTAPAESSTTSSLIASPSSSSAATTPLTASAASSTLLTVTLSTSTSSSSSSSAAAATSTVDSGSLSTDASNTASTGHLSTGARVGIAVGAIAGALVLFAAIFLLVRRIRRSRADDGSEKPTQSSFSGPAPATAVPAAAHTAHTVSEKPPRLSIRVSRPVSGLLPLSLLSGRSATRTSTGALGVQNNDHADRNSMPSSTEKAGSPVSSYASSISSASSDSPVLVVPAPNDPFAAKESAATSTTNVHRAIMDFAPTMHDELGLKDGMLVRILHEYDDGWALCVKLDRSAQGVCPRSCLSARALRPRPKRGANKPEEKEGRNITRTDPATPTIQVFAPDSERPHEIRL